MENARNSLFLHRTGQDLGRILFGFASVDDERQTGFSSGLDMGFETLALCLTVRLVVIIVEAAFPNRDHPRMVCRLNQGRRTEIGVRVSFVGMDPHAGPNIRMAIGDTDNISPLALARRDIEEAVDAKLSCVLEHFFLPFDEAFVVQMAVAIDQLHAAASSSSSSRRGNSGVGCAIGAPPLPASMRVSNLSAEAGMIGAIAWASARMAATRVPSTSAMRAGSVFRSVHGACLSMY